MANFIETWDNLTEEERMALIEHAQTAFVNTRWSRMVLASNAMVPTPYIALHDSSPTPATGSDPAWWQTISEYGGDYEVTLEEVPTLEGVYRYRRRAQIIGPSTIDGSAYHTNCRCWLEEENESGQIHVHGQYSQIVATRTSNPHFPSWGNPLDTLVYDVAVFMQYPCGDVTTHVIKDLRWATMQLVSDEVLAAGIPPMEYASIREWLEGLSRDIDKHITEVGRGRRKKLERLTGGAECDVIKWAQSHRTPQQTVESLESAGIPIVMSHSEAWVMSRHHPDYGTTTTMAFVAICPVGYGTKAIEELARMGYACRLLRRGKPDIPALLDLDDAILRLEEGKRYRKGMRKLGKKAVVVDTDEIPSIEV